MTHPTGTGFDRKLYSFASIIGHQHMKMAKSNLKRSISPLWRHCECNVNIVGPSKPMRLECLRFLCLNPKCWTDHSLTTYFAPSTLFCVLWSNSCICIKFKCRKGGDNTGQLWKSAVSDQKVAFRGSFSKNWTSFLEETQKPFVVDCLCQFGGCKTSWNTQHCHFGVNCSLLQRCSSWGLVRGFRVETVEGMTFTISLIQMVFF